MRFAAERRNHRRRRNGNEQDTTRSPGRNTGAGATRCGSSRTSEYYNDPGGDNGVAADIGAVTVDSTADGYISLKASVANMPQPGQAGFVVVVFDTDRNGATGSLMGGDYLLIFDVGSARGGLRHWNGTEYVDAAGDSATIVAHGSLEAKIKPAALGGATAFNFVVVAASGKADAAEIDAAPDNGTWFYELKAPVVTVDTIFAKFVPAAPKAGAVFQAPLVRLKLSNGRSVLAAQLPVRRTARWEARARDGQGLMHLPDPEERQGEAALDHALRHLRRRDGRVRPVRVPGALRGNGSARFAARGRRPIR